MEAVANDSGLIEFIPENVEQTPEEPGVYLVVTSSQKVIYVGQTGDRGIRESLWEVLEEQPFGAIEYFRYVVATDSARAEEIAGRYISELKPPHNLGYGRFRNEEVELPKQGHSIRHSAPNP